MGFAKDTDGFYTATPTVGWQNGYAGTAPATSATMVIFVSNLTGFDTDGTGASQGDGSFAHPYRTIAKALTRTGGGVRSGSPDWVLLANGETWTDQAGAASQFGPGLDEQNRMIFGGYDKTATVSTPSNPPIPNPRTGVVARPIIKVPGGDPFAYGVSGPRAYTAIMGIDFYDYTRDTVANPANASNTPVNAGITLTFDVAPGNILIEDCVVRWFAVGITADAYSVNCPMAIRRNIIINNWGDKYGIGSWQMTPNFLIEENFLDFNGWDLVGQPDGGSLNHNWYISGNNTLSSAVGDGIAVSDLYMHGNITTNCLFQDNNRCGGHLNNNLWQLGGTGGTNYGPNNPAVANLVENEVAIGGFFGGATHTNYADSFLEMGAGPGPDTNLGYYGNGVPGIQHVNVNNCITTQAGGGPASGSIAISGGFVSNLVTVSNCYCYKFSSNVVGPGAADCIDGGGNLATTSPATAASFGWSHPERTPPTYMAEVMHDGSTWADFVRRCRLQSRRNWEPLLMAESVNDYIREGFGKTMIGSAYADGSSPPDQVLMPQICM